MARPAIVAFVGIDGAGKTTQARWLADWLTSRDVRATYWQNAGARLILGRLARRLGRADAVDLLGRTGFLTVEASVRWLAIGRALLRSRLSRRVAVMDRYSYCQYAIMRARGDRGERLARAWYALYPRPDVVVFLALAPVEARRRIEVRGYDTEELSYLSAVDAAYRALPESAGFVVVDADVPQEAVAAAVRAAVGTRLGLDGWSGGCPDGGPADARPQ